MQIDSLALRFSASFFSCSLISIHWYRIVLRLIRFFDSQCSMPRRATQGKLTLYYMASLFGKDIVVLSST
jgi:hypothetical protein